MEFSNETLHEIQIRMEGKLDNIEKHLKKQNGRIGKLENWRSFTLGASAIINIILIPLVIKMFLDR